MDKRSSFTSAFPTMSLFSDRNVVVSHHKKPLYEKLWQHFFKNIEINRTVEIEQNK